MARIRHLFFILIILVLGCTDDDASPEVQEGTLAAVLEGESFETGSVIACASGSENADEIIAYLYPRPGVTEIAYFETDAIAVDEQNYENYKRIDLPVSDLFNGYLKKFTRTTSTEKWVIISFRESGRIHISNPIRLKHKTQNTTFADAVAIDQSTFGSPVFSWVDIAGEQDAIYFQVVSNATNELLSGTYTFDTQFQYYNLENVVLNITLGTPPDLEAGDLYHFTLMAVSADNWVNHLVEKSPFSFN